MIDRKFAFLGAGNMAGALIQGLIRAGTPAAQIWATVRRDERAQELTTAHPGIHVGQDNLAAAAAAEIIVLAVKPQGLDKLVKQVAATIDSSRLVISIAAGVPIAAIQKRLGSSIRIIRAMPNTPALVGLGATALSGGEHATDADLQLEVPRCGFDFEQKYGARGKNFAEVHHLNLLAESGVVQTRLSDLRVVCSNCHRMIHRVSPMADVETLIPVDT